MRRVASWLAKGSVGKTTAALDLSAALAIAGERVPLVDLDTQASATRGLGLEPADGLLAAIRGEPQLRAPTCSGGGAPFLTTAPVRGSRTSTKAILPVAVAVQVDPGLIQGLLRIVA